MSNYPQVNKNLILAGLIIALIAGFITKSIGLAVVVFFILYFLSYSKRIVAYAKDNPKGYWFKAKLFGWGWMPVKWQGWLVTLVYVAVLVHFGVKIDSNSHSVSDSLIGFSVPFVISTIVFLLIAYKKGERPRWQWGWPKE